MAVAGAAMELRSPIGLDGYGEEAVGAGLDKAARQIVLHGTSGLVNCMRVGVGHKGGSSHRRHTWCGDVGSHLREPLDGVRVMKCRDIEMPVVVR